MEKNKNQAKWTNVEGYVPIIPSFGKLGQKVEFKASLGYTQQVCLQNTKQNTTIPPFQKGQGVRDW